MSSIQYESALVTERSADIEQAASSPSSRIHVDISAVLGGAVIAAAISWVMASFGAGIGLAATPNNSAVGMSAVGLSVATGLWVMWIAVSSFAAGGYVAGRMRRLSYDSSEHERDVRDGAHGLMVWAVGLLVLAWLASPALSGLGKASAAAAAATTVTEMAQDGDAHVIDQLSRGGGSSATSNDAAFRDDIRRTLTLAAASGSLPGDDRSYLAQQVAAREGIAPADAEKKIDDAMARLTAAAQKAREAATSARRAGIILAFLTGASLVVGAAAAWRAASAGGHHRDEQTDLSHLTTWR